MSAYSGAFGSQAGYNQSGGGYYYVVSNITLASTLAYIPGSGSGGATTVGSFTPYTSTLTDANVGFSTLFSAGRIIKDMGKTVVSAGRAFRKFQAVIPASSSTGGVSGGASSSTQAGYFSAYLEVAAPNAGGSGVIGAPIVRYA